MRSQHWSLQGNVVLVSQWFGFCFFVCQVFCGLKYVEIMFDVYMFNFEI